MTIKKNKILITPALPYVNNTPHLGNIIGSVLIGDILARKYRMEPENEVLFVGGTDEYGTQTMMKALEEDKSCYDICTEYGKIHATVYKWFSIEFDYFGRTSTNNPKEDKDWLHTKITQEIFTKLNNNGFIYSENSRQLYCSALDMFVSDRFVSGTCYVCGYNSANGDQCDKCCTLIDANRLINPVCRVKGKEYDCSMRETLHYYLNLTKLKPEIETLYTLNNKNWSKNVRPVTQSWLNILKDRCITRDIHWGTPVPNVENKSCFCWFDAPIGYISCVANYFQEKEGNPEKYREWFCSDDSVTTIHAFSKDNIVFHTIMFQGTLIGTCDKYNLTSTNSEYKIASCEYLNFMTPSGPEKFSKSRKVGIFGDHVIAVSEKLKITSDYWRYYLVKIRPETSDSVFDLNEFVKVCNTDLCCKYGNLINRLRKFYEMLAAVSTNSDDLIFDCSECINLDILQIEKKYHEYFDQLQLRQAQACCMQMVDYANQYVSEATPWKIDLSIEENKIKYQNIVGKIAWILIITNECFRPFIPNKANLIGSLYEISNGLIILEFEALKDIVAFDKLNVDTLRKELADIGVKC